MLRQLSRGLGLSCPQTKALSMLVKQACHHLAAVGRLAFHLAYWLGISLQGLLPVMPSAGLMVVGYPPVQYAHLLSLLHEVFSVDCVDTRRLPEVKSVATYRELPSPLPLLWWNVSGLTWLGRASGPG